MRLLLIVAAFVVAGASTAGGAVGAQVYHVTSADTSWHPLYLGMSIRGGGTRRSGRLQYDYDVIVSVDSLSPAARAGLRVGDEILSINGFDLVTERDSARYRGAGVPTALRVRRGAEILEVTITPQRNPSLRPPL